MEKLINVNRQFNNYIFLKFGAMYKIACMMEENYSLHDISSYITSIIVAEFSI